MRCIYTHTHIHTSRLLPDFPLPSAVKAQFYFNHPHQLTNEFLQLRNEGLLLLATWTCGGGGGGGWSGDQSQ